MKKKILNFSLILLFFASFMNANKTDYEKLKVENKLSAKDKGIILGEDLNDFNAYVKNIYIKNKTVYIEIDIIQVKYVKDDERVIRNQNPKIRTYVIDRNSLIYSDDCKNLKPSDVMKIKDRLLKNNAISIGQSKDGKMKNINFGCYG
jgi:hypothetical protein